MARQIVPVTVRYFAADRYAEWSLDWDRTLVVYIDIGNWSAPDLAQFVWPFDFVLGVECLAVAEIEPVWVAAYLDCPTTIALPYLPIDVIWAQFVGGGLFVAAAVVKRSFGFEMSPSPS